MLFHFANFAPPLDCCLYFHWIHIQANEKKKYTKVCTDLMSDVRVSTSQPMMSDHCVSRQCLDHRKLVVYIRKFEICNHSPNKHNHPTKHTYSIICDAAECVQICYVNTLFGFHTYHTIPMMVHIGNIKYLVSMRFYRNVVCFCSIKMRHWLKPSFQYELLTFSMHTRIAEKKFTSFGKCSAKMTIESMNHT